MSDPVRIPPRVPDKPRIPDEASERRLFEIRREGESKGIVKGAGVRPAGAPFPMASVETGYYGIPLLKEPSWTWEIPLYFFVGGAAGSAAGQVATIAPTARPSSEMGSAAVSPERALARSKRELRPLTAFDAAARA